MSRNVIISVATGSLSVKGKRSGRILVFKSDTIYYKARKIEHVFIGYSQVILDGTSARGPPAVVTYSISSKRLASY